MQLYEWEVFKGGKWHGSLRHFPQVMRKLKIVEPKPGSAMVEEASSRRMFGDAPPQHCVLTDDACTKIINLDKGFPLPENGGYWAWIGGWRVDKHIVVTNNTSTPKSKVDCDNNGWSYAENQRDFIDNPAELCWDSCRIDGKFCSRPWRRRKWTRQRALISYPQASERSTHYLRLLAENERNAVVAAKLSDQLVTTKTRLTETEERLFTVTDSMQHEIDSLKAKLEVREKELFRLIEVGLVNTKSSSPPSAAATAAALEAKESLMDKLGKEGVDKVKFFVSSVEDVISNATQSLRKPDEKTPTATAGAKQSAEKEPTNETDKAKEEGQNKDAADGATVTKIADTEPTPLDKSMQPSGSKDKTDVKTASSDNIDKVKNLMSSVMTTSTTALSSATLSLRKSSDASDKTKDKDRALDGIPGTDTGAGKTIGGTDDATNHGTTTDSDNPSPSGRLTSSITMTGAAAESSLLSMNANRETAANEEKKDETETESLRIKTTGRDRSTSHDTEDSMTSSAESGKGKSDRGRPITPRVTYDSAPKSPPLSKQTADWISMGRDALIGGIINSHQAGSALFQNISRRHPDRAPVEDVALPDLQPEEEEGDGSSLEGDTSEPSVKDKPTSDMTAQHEPEGLVAA